MVSPVKCSLLGYIGLGAEGAGDLGTWAVAPSSSAWTVFLLWMGSHLEFPSSSRNVFVPSHLHSFSLSWGHLRNICGKGPAMKLAES